MAIGSAVAPLAAGGGGRIDRPPPILYTFSMICGATTGSTKNVIFLTKALDTSGVAVIIEHRTQNTEHRKQKTENRKQKTEHRK
ncbi:MAG: hypothetical protein K2H73_08410, partial [Treponemataceae bacterium]|nr:hypothetical protein [Treponemataceae bacterium]